MYIVLYAKCDGNDIILKQYRLWRKNRVDNGRNCHGTDLNRNFGYNWNPGKFTQISSNFNGHK
jgi:hypothetical protein